MKQTVAQKRYGQRRTLANKMERFAETLENPAERLTVLSLSDMLRTPYKRDNHFFITYSQED